MDGFVSRLTGKIAEVGFVERRLGCHIGLIERGDIVFVCGFRQDVDVFVVIGGTAGAGRLVDYVVVVGVCPETGWDVDIVDVNVLRWAEIVSFAIVVGAVARSVEVRMAVLIEVAHVEVEQLI